VLVEGSASHVLLGEGGPPAALPSAQQETQGRGGLAHKARLPAGFALCN
jgi:hypothetical protein